MCTPVSDWCHFPVQVAMSRSRHVIEIPPVREGFNNLVVGRDAGLVPTITIDLVSQELLKSEAGLCLRRGFGTRFVRC